jgi:hypothetical protein
MTTSRIDMRIDDEIKAAAEKAAALLGTKSLTEYIVRLSVFSPIEPFRFQLNGASEISL